MTDHPSVSRNLPCAFCVHPEHRAPCPECECGQPTAGEANAATERFRGLAGAWDDDAPLTDTIRLFADMLGPEYRGWAEVFRGWAHRIDAEVSPHPSSPLNVDDLAQIIREVDGDHSLGAAALAEAILAHRPHDA